MTAVAILGTGTMGAAMALRAAGEGLEVRAFNRSHERAQALERAGLTAFTTAAEAVSGSDVIVTMLADADAVLDTMSGDQGAVAGAGQGTVWAQMSTIGIEGTDRCAALAERSDLVLVDAPVLGTKQPAEKGELVVLASGPSEALETCRPLFDAVGSRTLELGEAGAGTRLKLVVNHWLVSIVQGLAETITLAEAIDVDPEQFLDTIKGGGLDLPYAQMKGRAMIERNFEPSFKLSLARKDAQLVLEAAANSDHPAQLARTIAALMDRAIEQGHGEEDLAAAYFGSASGAASPHTRAR